MEQTQIADGSWIHLWRRALPSTAELHEHLVGLPMAQETYVLWGRQVRAPRLTAWHGDQGRSYRWSGLTREPRPWTAGLVSARETVERITGLSFDSVLVNLYRDGRDGVAWHSDDEPEVGPSAADRHVASLSIGAARRFVLRPLGTGMRVDLVLGDGDLLLMRGRVQSTHEHCVPKTKRAVGPRYNLTFRCRPAP